MNVHRREAVIFEKKVCHPFAVSGRIQWRLEKQHRLLLRINAKIGERGIPDMLHVFKFFYDALFDGILECEDASLVLGITADVGSFWGGQGRYSPRG